MGAFFIFMYINVATCCIYDSIIKNINPSYIKENTCGGVAVSERNVPRVYLEEGGACGAGAAARQGLAFVGVERRRWLPFWRNSSRV